MARAPRGTSGCGHESCQGFIGRRSPRGPLSFFSDLLVLLFVLFAAGWTGQVMVWDVQGQVLAVEGARLLDVLPIFAEPISRAFVGERELPGAFFFLNLFAHIALPVGTGCSCGCTSRGWRGPCSCLRRGFSGAWWVCCSCCPWRGPWGWRGRRILSACRDRRRSTSSTRSGSL